MSNLLELTAAIVSAHVSSTQMSSEEMLQELHKVHTALKALEANEAQGAPLEEEPKTLTMKQAFKKDEVICMICGKGFKTLKRHLAQAHNLKPGQYRKQFNIPSSQSLAAKSYSESRRKAAVERGLGDVLAKAREKRAANKAGKPAAVKAQTPAKKVKVSAPAPKKKASTAVNKTKPSKA